MSGFDDHPWVQGRKRAFPGQPFVVADTRGVLAVAPQDIDEDARQRASMNLVRGAARDALGIDARVVVTMVVEERGRVPLLVAECATSEAPAALLVHVRPHGEPERYFAAIRQSGAASVVGRIERSAAVHRGRWHYFPFAYAEAAARLAAYPGDDSAVIGTIRDGEWVQWHMSSDPPPVPAEPRLDSTRPPPGRG